MMMMRMRMITDDAVEVHFSVRLYTLQDRRPRLLS